MKSIENRRQTRRLVLLATCLVALNALTALYPERGAADESVDATPAKQVLPPYKMTNKDILYPDRAKRDGVEGKVLVAFDIAAGGRVPT